MAGDLGPAPAPASQVIEVCERLERAQAKAHRRSAALAEAAKKSKGTFEQRDAILEAVQAGTANPPTR